MAAVLSFVCLISLVTVIDETVLASHLKETNTGQCTVCQSVTDSLAKLQDALNKVQNNVLELQKNMVELKSNQAKLMRQYGKDCAEIYKSGNDVKKSGVYTIYPSDTIGPIEVYCDMTTDGGGWTMFQRRQDGSVDFYRGWQDYKLGFGKLNGEFWLGNDYLNRLTNQDSYELRIDLEDTSGTQVYAVYDRFSISSEKTNYTLSVGVYSGNAGDSLAPHSKGSSFSTKDHDDDRASQNCAERFKGAWWYGGLDGFCHYSNLNGLYHHGVHASYGDGVNWKDFKGHNYSLKRTEMKIRPVGFKSSL